MASGLTDSLLMHAVQRTDLGLCRQLNHWGIRERVRQYFSIVSRLGDGPAWYALILLFPLADPQHRWQVSLLMALAGAIALTLYRYLKRHTRRPRPFAAHSEILALTAPLDEFSFPSGHTLHAVTYTAIAVVYLPVLAWLLVPFSLSIALSRVVLGLHYPSDVLVAAGIGLSLARLVLTLAPALAV